MSSSESDEISGMSCSTMTSMATRLVAQTSRSAAERLALALRDARRRLVEQQDRGSCAITHGQVDDAPRTGRELAHELVAERSPGRGARAARRPARTTSLLRAHGARQRERGRRRGRARRGGARARRRVVSATVSDGNRRASWNDRPRPGVAAAPAAQLGDIDAVEDDTTPVGGTKPEMMSNSVVLPAPFARSDRGSRLARAPRSTSSTRADAAEAAHEALRPRGGGDTRGPSPLPPHDTDRSRRPTATRSPAAPP